MINSLLFVTTQYFPDYLAVDQGPTATVSWKAALMRREGGSMSDRCTDVQSELSNCSSCICSPRKYCIIDSRLSVDTEMDHPLSRGLTIQSTNHGVLVNS